MKEWSPKFNLNRQRLTNFRSNLIHGLFSNRKEPPSIVNCCLQNLLNLNTINSFPDYGLEDIWRRILLAPLAFPLQVQQVPPTTVASTAGPSMPLWVTA